MNQYRLYILLTLNFFQVLSSSQEEWVILYSAFYNNDMSEVEFWSTNTVGIKNLIYSCQGNFMFGGFGIFGYNTIISKQFILPPHFNVRVKFDFWKIDSWDGECIQVVIDDVVSKNFYYYPSGTQLCGGLHQNRFEMMIPMQYTFAHNSEFLSFVMRDTLDQNPYDESWGIRNFQILIQKCPNSCVICHLNENECYHQTQTDHFKINQWQSIQSIPIQSSECVLGINMVGGYGILDQYSVINSKFQLEPHQQIRIQIQFFLIDIESLINSFDLDIDGAVQTFELSSKSQYSICAQGSQESFNNIDYTMYHDKQDMSITIRPKNLVGARPFWGILSLNLFVLRCPQNCLKCIYYDICLLCIDEWTVENQKCNRLQNPVTINQIQIKQIFYPVNFSTLKTNQSIILQKDDTSLDLNITIQCNENYQIQSTYIICHSCKSSDTLHTSYKCQGKLKGIMFNINLTKLTITSEQLLITRNDISYELIQIFYDNGIKQEKILEITQKAI